MVLATTNATTTVGELSVEPSLVSPLPYFQTYQTPPYLRDFIITYHNIKKVSGLVRFVSLEDFSGTPPNLRD